ncbi:MAG TPA: hypothetical protein PKC49_16180 [Phycisphaerae bacterium]|nr:hypothetical protein [Phycisphaerae bacterium]
MAATAGLLPQVVSDLGLLGLADRRSFFEELHRVCESPIRRSELCLDSTISRYALRRFSFGVGGERIAVFHYQESTDRVRVLRCRRARPLRMREPPECD